MQSSPLIWAADAVCRACCFIAVLSLPLYFSVLTTTGYEPDKAVLLRVLAIVAGGAWLAGQVARGDWSARSVPPLVWAGVALFATFALATLLSIDARLSLWGSQARQEGLVTWAAYLVFLVVAATRLQRGTDWRRLISALLLGSVPVALYGYLQQLGADPIPAAGSPDTLAWPVRSTLGQHVFLGSYLVMVIPFALARFLENRHEPASEPNGNDWRGATVAAGLVAGMAAAIFTVMVVGVYYPALYALYPAVLGASAGVVLLLERLPAPQLSRITRWAYGALTIMLGVTLAISGARGAWLGFLASLPVFGILLAWALGRRDIARRALAVSAAAGLLLVLLNIPGGPLQPLRTVHGIGRIANITDSGGAQGSAQGRILIWQGVVHLMRDTPAIGGNWGGPLRDITGYGPETLHWAFQAVFPLKLRQVTSEIWTWDRSHNIYLDILVDAGLLGLLAFAALLLLFFKRIAERLLTAGAERDTGGRVTGTNSLLLIAMAAAVAGHLIDGFFGLETPVTLLLLALFAGLVAQPASVAATAAEPELPSGIRQFAVLCAGLLVGGIALVALPVTWPATLLVAVWVIGLVAAIRGVTLLIGVPPAPRARLRLGLRTLASVVVGVLVVGMLVNQMQYEGAAVAERIGLTSLGGGNVEGAVSSLQLAAAQDPYEPQYRTELAGAYLTLGANHLDSAHPDFVPSASNAVGVNPATASGLSRDQLFELGALVLQSARHLSPLDPDAYSNLGNLYLEWGRPAAAMPYFRQAEALSHENPRYVDQEALADLQAGRSGAARARAASAFALDDTFWYTYYTMALVDHSLGDHAGSRQAASLALVWVHNYWPSPPQSQITQLQQLRQVG